MEMYCQRLSLVKEALMHVSTKGEDTLLMADCLRALQEIIIQLNQVETKEEK